MNHQDAEIADIVIVLNECYADKIANAIDLLTAAGVEIIAQDLENNVVEGSIESFKLPALQKIECVNYVRTVLTYIADYPTGDPRDLDPADEDDDADAA